MPFVRIALAGTDPTPAQVADLQRRATALMAEALDKRADLTVVTVQREAAANWSVGGAALPDGAPLAQLEALVTADTNSAAQKAAFIRAAHDMLATVLGPLASPVYVVVRELPAGDWGYDGATQAARRAAPRDGFGSP
jgi:4-oxalocrotonate tautomerase